MKNDIINIENIKKYIINNLSLENRKNNTEIISYFIINNLNKITNNNKTYSFYILVFLHYTFILITFIYFILSDINYKFYISILIILCIFILHFYFRGCILIRVERKLLNNKEWYGIWNFIIFPLKFIGFDITSGLINNIFICFGIITLFFILIKILFFTQIKLILKLIFNNKFNI
jgi:hypothetical protein